MVDFFLIPSSALHLISGIPGDVIGPFDKVQECMPDSSLPEAFSDPFAEEGGGIPQRTALGTTFISEVGEQEISCARLATLPELIGRFLWQLTQGFELSLVSGVFIFAGPGALDELESTITSQGVSEAFCFPVERLHGLRNSVDRKIRFCSCPFLIWFGRHDLSGK